MLWWLLRKWRMRSAEKWRIRSNEQRIKELRRRGARIGDRCRIHSMQFSTEPYLIEIADDVVIASGVEFVTHHALAALIRHKHPGFQVFGRIRVESGTLIGINCIILPGVEIGANCIIGAGSVVRGAIPDNSLVVGNPARVVGRASLALANLEKSPCRLDVFNASPEERRRRIEELFHIT